VRSFFLIIGLLFFTASCSRPDFDTSIQIEAWLESIHPDTKVIEVDCTSNVEDSPGSGTWKYFAFKHQFSALEVLESSIPHGMAWGALVARMVKVIEFGFSSYVAEEQTKTPSAIAAYKMKFRYKDLRCEGKPLRSPPLAPLLCPNDTNGCSTPPTPTDQPPLPPPPPGGGDF